MNDTTIPRSDCGTDLVDRTVQANELPVSTDGTGQVSTDGTGQVSTDRTDQVSTDGTGQVSTDRTDQVTVATRPTPTVRYYPDRALEQPFDTSPTARPMEDT